MVVTLEGSASKKFPFGFGDEIPADFSNLAEIYGQRKDECLLLIEPRKVHDTGHRPLGNHLRIATRQSLS